MSCTAVEVTTGGMYRGMIGGHHEMTSVLYSSCREVPGRLSSNSNSNSNSSLISVVLNATELSYSSLIHEIMSVYCTPAIEFGRDVFRAIKKRFSNFYVVLNATEPSYSSSVHEMTSVLYTSHRDGPGRLSCHQNSVLINFLWF